MIYTVRLLAVVVVLVGSGGSQQCNQLVCPENGCLARDAVCNGAGECIYNGRGNYIDEIFCNGKIFRMHVLNSYSNK